MNDLNLLLNSYGTTSTGDAFNFANMMAWIIFSIIGFCAFNYGRKERNYRPFTVGLVLMVYPYFVSNTVLLYLMGVGVSSLLYFWRE